MMLAPNGTSAVAPRYCAARAPVARAPRLGQAVLVLLAMLAVLAMMVVVATIVDEHGGILKRLISAPHQLQNTFLLSDELKKAEILFNLKQI